MTRLLPALTFLVGLVLGGLIVGVGLDRDAGAPPRSAGPAPGATTPPTPDRSTPPAGTTVTVPAACADAVATVQEALDLVRTGVDAIRDLQPDELLAVVERLEALEPRARALGRQCAAVRVGSPTPGGS